MTFTPVPNVLHFGSLFTLTTAARWTFIAGPGSFAADATLRTQFDTAYFHKTGMLPPLTLTQTPSDINATWLSSNPLWSPTSSGPVKQGIGAGGDDASIGMLTDWQVVHFFNQSAAGEQVVRTIGYANAFSSISLRDLTTRNLANISGGSYTGMPASNPNLQWYAEGVAANGFTAPPAGNSNFMWSENNTSHKPPFAYYAALVFGGPDLLNLVIENANGGALNLQPSSQRNWTTPYAVDGIAIAAPDGALARGAAWAYRDRHFAAALAPSSHPDGSQVSTYTTAVALANSAYMIAVINASYTNAYAVAIGLHYFIEAFGPAACNASSGAGFTMAYFACAVAFAACARLRDANAQTFISDWATFLAHMGGIFGAYHLYTEYDHCVLPPRSNSDDDGVPITMDPQWAIPANPGTLSWTSAGFSGQSGWLHGWTPANGDKWMFDDTASTPCPSNFSTNVPYWARDTAFVSGTSYTWNLAAAPAGASNWAASTSYPSNSFVQPTSGNAGNYVHAQINPAGGTSGGSAPSWPQTVGNTVNDNGLTWVCLGTSAAIAPSGSGTVSGTALGGFGGPWATLASPPAASTGLVPTSGAYCVWLDAAFASFMAAATLLGFSLPSGFSALRTDSQARIAAGNLYNASPGTFNQWQCQTTL